MLFCIIVLYNVDEGQWIMKTGRKAVFSFSDTIDENNNDGKKYIVFSTYFVTEDSLPHSVLGRFFHIYSAYY